MGVDRTTNVGFGIANLVDLTGDGLIFDGGDPLWRAMQLNMIAFINNNGGQANLYFYGVCH